MGSCWTSRLARLYLRFERLGVADARRAQVDADDLALRLAQGVFGRLRGAAAGDQHVQVRAVGLLRPVQVEVRAAPALILPAPAVAVQVFHRRRIRMRVVEGLHGLLGAVTLAAVSCQWVHDMNTQ